ncbi:MAG: PIN domain-containing protein [Candidatus Omnitrophota bacterium]
MFTITFLRIFFTILSVVCGYYLGYVLTDLTSKGAMLGAGIGFFVAMCIIFVEVKLRRVSLRNLSVTVFGLVFGFFIAWMLTRIIRLIPMEESIYSTFQIIFTVVFCYLGMIISIKGKDEFNLIIPYVRFSREDQREQFFLLDTSVIIDGRIASICETGFLLGKLVVPRFILQELQQVADSSDESKRARGRRGLDMLNRLKQIPGSEVIIHDESFPEIREVDAKLVRLSKVLDCPVLTNDFNLNKVAKLEGVSVLNINDLANALRPVVLPGEQMTVSIRKEGKEKNQGLAFLNDGTMIVIDNAKRLIGKNVDVTVTSVLQTSAGRMIFANLVEGPVQRGQQPGQRGQQPGQRGQQPGQRGQQPGQRGQQPGQRGQQPGQRDQQPGQRDQQPGQRDQQPGQRDQQPGQKHQQS